MAIGLLLLKFALNVYNFTGPIDFIERWVTAGTPAFIKILGVILVILGMGTIFGIWAWLTDPLVEGVKDLTGSNLKK